MPGEDARHQQHGVASLRTLRSHDFILLSSGRCPKPRLGVATPKNPIFFKSIPPGVTRFSPPRPQGAKGGGEKNCVTAFGQKRLALFKLQLNMGVKLCCVHSGRLRGRRWGVVLLAGGCARPSVLCRVSCWWPRLLRVGHRRPSRVVGRCNCRRCARAALCAGAVRFGVFRSRSHRSRFRLLCHLHKGRGPALLVTAGQAHFFVYDPGWIFRFAFSVLQLCAGGARAGVIRPGFRARRGRRRCARAGSDRPALLSGCGGLSCSWQAIHFGPGHSFCHPDPDCCQVRIRVWVCGLSGPGLSDWPAAVPLFLKMFRRVWLRFVVIRSAGRRSRRAGCGLRRCASVASGDAAASERLGAVVAGGIIRPMVARLATHPGTRAAVVVAKKIYKKT